MPAGDPCPHGKMGHCAECIMHDQKQRMKRYMALPVNEQRDAAEKQLMEYARAFIDQTDLVDELRLRLEYRDTRISELQIQVERLTAALHIAEKDEP